MTLSLRALTFVMSTLTSPVPIPYSVPRRAVWAAWALATSVFVGMQPEFTQVPPTSLRSITATVCPAAVSLPASGGPAWPAPMMIASNFCAAVAIQMTDASATIANPRRSRWHPRQARPAGRVRRWRATSRWRASAPPSVPMTAPISAAPIAPTTTHAVGFRTAPVARTAPANAPVNSRAPNC